MSETKDTILIIDDDQRNIFALSAVLKARGYHLLSAASAEQGIQLLSRQPGIKVVLLDMMMPEMDGYETLAIIRNDAQLKDKKVVAVTAQAMKGDRERCLEAGADDYLSKPVDVDALAKLLNAYEVKR